MEHSPTADGSCPRPWKTISGWQDEAAQPRQPQQGRWKHPESLPEPSVKSLLPIHIPSSPPQQVSSAAQLLQIYIRAWDVRNWAEALKATFFFIKPDINHQPDLPWVSCVCTWVMCTVSVPSSWILPVCLFSSTDHREFIWSPYSCHLYYQSNFILI